MIRIGVGMIDSQFIAAFLADVVIVSVVHLKRAYLSKSVYYKVLEPRVTNVIGIADNGENYD